MRINTLKLENFRSHEKYEIFFPKEQETVLFLGKNGIGKTNILESIYTLSLGKSFRTNQFTEMINWEADFSRTSGEIEGAEAENLEVFFSKAPKKQKNYKKNGVSISHKNFLGTLLSVLFHPEDLNMLYLSPSYRRRYLDIVLSQTDKEYLDALLNYNKVLKQRNNLIKELQKKLFEQGINSINFDNLEIWDIQLIVFASEILRKRIIFTTFLNNLLEKHYKKISLGNEMIKIEYSSKNKDLNEKNTEEILNFEISNRRQKDIYSGKTTFGPHLDDLIFQINNRNISESASRGEFRTILLALKLAEIDYIKSKKNLSPVLLLDDVFSELDSFRQEYFLKSIEDCQSIITGTSHENLKETGSSIKVIEII